MRIYSLLACLPFALAACGGGGGEGFDYNGDRGSVVTDDAILETLSSANIDSKGFPWDGTGAGITKRWDLPIPVKTNGDLRAVAAMDELEDRLGLPLFDRISIESQPDGSITEGLIFSQGTSYLPSGGNPQHYCANVADGPNAGGYPANFYDASTGVINTRLYINLDNNACIANADIVVHEFGHALGLGDHFGGFGDGPAISRLFYADLKTLYSNPPGTSKVNLLIVK